MTTTRSPDRTLAKIDEAIAIVTKNGRRPDSDGVGLFRKLGTIIASRSPILMTVGEKTVPVPLNDITMRKTVLQINLERHGLGVAAFTPGEVSAEYDEVDESYMFVGYSVPANDEGTLDVRIDFLPAAA